MAKKSSALLAPDARQILKSGPTSAVADLSPELQSELDALANLPDDTIDTDDIPEAPLSNMMDGERGRFFRPVKIPVTIRLDADLVEWYKSHAKNGRYQTEINRALRLYMQANRKGDFVP